MKKILSTKIILLMLFSLNTNTKAQVKISNSSAIINPKIVLHLKSSGNNKGLLLIRAALQATDLPNPNSLNGGEHLQYWNRS